MNPHRITLALALGGLALGLAIPAAPARAQDFDRVRIETQTVAPGLYMMTGRGGNLAVSVGEDGVFLVDDQFAPLTEKIRAAIAHLSDAPVRFVLNTHWHGDHTGGNENLGKAGALIVAHDNVRKRMSVEQFIAAFDRKVPPSPDVALPVITFGEDVTFHVNGHDVHVFHVDPAHTDGDSIVHFRTANVIHAGDTYFNGRYPFIDLSSGGSVDGMIAAVERVKEISDPETRIIPGHGPLSNKSELERYGVMLTTARDRIREGIGKGQSVEQVIASRPTSDFDAAWGGGFVGPEQFVRTVYASLSSR